MLTKNRNKMRKRKKRKNHFFYGFLTFGTTKAKENLCVPAAKVKTEDLLSKFDARICRVCSPNSFSEVVILPREPIPVVLL
jgi:hypothetical protein